MTREEFIQDKINVRYPDLEVKIEGHALKMEIASSELTHLLGFLQMEGMEHLSCLTCVDWNTHLEMVYILIARSFKETIFVKTKLDRENPEIDTISKLWKGAEFHEREVYDMFGVKFKNHPDLRRILLDDEWVGFPLRKDYDDPVNIIPL